MSTVTTSMPIPMVRHARDNRPTLTTLGDTYRIIIEGSGRTSSGELLTDATARQRALYAREVAATGCTTLEEVLSTHGKDSPLYQNARAAARDRRTHKERFPAIIPAAFFDGRGRSAQHLTELSGLVPIDLDHLDDAAVERNLAELRRLGCCVLCYVSPSGSGIKAVIAVDPVPEDLAEYGVCWQVTGEWLASCLSGSPVVDPSGKDATKLCFLSHDPEAYLNIDPTPHPWHPPTRSQKEEPAPTSNRKPDPPVEGSVSDAEVDRDALRWIEPPQEYNTWLGWLPTLKALDLSVEEAEQWSSAGAGYIQGEVAERWNGLPEDSLEDARYKLRGHAYNRGWRAQQRVEVADYTYAMPDGTIRFQVVRYHPKAFMARRPDPSRHDEWIWDLKRTSPILYRLPELRRSDRDQTVWIVEGEQDADRLHSLGLIATTSPFGPGKWRRSFNKELRRRQVAVIPDNDRSGIDHAVQVATSIAGVAASVRIAYLPDAPEGGNVSWWLDQGHTVQELQDLLATALPFEPDDPHQEDSPERQKPDWKVSPLLEGAERITELLGESGHFVYSGQDAYYFDQDSRQLMALDQDNLQLRLLLGRRFRINARDQLYGYIVGHLFRHAFESGREALIRRFSHYDQDSNIVYLDMGQGRVLRITADSISVHDNGGDDVLFQPVWKHQPWEYVPPGNRPEHVLYQQYVKQINFTSEDSEFDVQDQRGLLLVWLISFAFESIMPTKVLAAAVGPSGSGKSSLFRNAGRILMGPRFQVSALSKEAEGEKDFWIALTHSFYRCYDNIDESVRWLPDALAQVTTGAERPSRRKYTDEGLVETDVSCMLAITARTPRACLRREDVASRTLLFKVRKLQEVKPEYELLAGIDRLRDAFLSDYATMVQKVLARPLAEVKVADPTVRMADFARLATWIGHGLGDQMGALIDGALSRMTSSQHRFAVEVDPVASALEIWLGRAQPLPEGAMELDVPDLPTRGGPS